MRIVYFHQYFTTPDMSGGTRSYEMARRMVDAGHEVHVVTTWRDQTSHRDWWQTDVAGITVHWLPVPYDNSLSFGRRIRAFLRFAMAAGRYGRRLRPDLVVATSTPLTIIIPAYQAIFGRRTPLVFEVRDLWPELPIAMGALRNPAARWVARGLEKFAYAASDQVIALSPGMAAGVARGGVPQDRITVIPNGCDLALFAPSAAGAARFRASHPLLGNRPIVLYAGTFGRINGVGYLVDLAVHLRDSHPDLRFVAIGSGAEYDAVRQRAARNGLLDDTVLILPAMPKTDLVDAFAAATVSCSLFIDLPQMQANSANKFFDTLASGTPVAINYEGWQADLIRTHGVGVVMHPNPAKGAKALALALDDPKALHAAGEHARALAAAQFARDDLGEQFLQVITRAATQGRAGWRLSAMVKRTTDIVLAVTALVVLAPLMLWTGWRVARDMGRPVIFAQDRTGKGGRRFKMFKFRTMRPETGGDDSDAARLTPLGARLRATSLDELPELWNVLRGEMSLVGPRPLLPEYLPLYSLEQARRHSVRPGITGWAQINGRNAISWEEKFRLDVWYVDHRSFWLDLKILCLTLAKVLRRDGISAAGEVTMPRFTGSQDRGTQ